MLTAEQRVENKRALDRRCYLRRRQERSTAMSAVQQVFRRTFAGKIEMTYRGMQSRVRGQNNRQYAGLQLLLRADFKTWAANDPAFAALFAAWEASGFAGGLSPSIDRIDPDRGYTPDNIQWLTRDENSRKAKLQRPHPRDPTTGRLLPLAP